MTLDELEEFFDKHNNEFLEFDRVEIKQSNRSDLHAFLLLDRLFPSNDDIVSCADYGEIWLDVTPTELAETASEQQIIELIRCGVRYSDCSLKMFV